MTTTLDYSPPNTTPYIAEPADDAILSLLEAGGLPPSGLLVELPLDWLVPDPANERGDFAADADWAEFVASIQERGILQPVQVFRLAPRRYMLGSGHRRKAGAEAAGMTSIPAIIKPVPASEADQALDRLAANLHKPLDPIRRAQTFATLLESRHLTQAQLAKHAGTTQTRVSLSLSLLKLPPAVQEMIAGGQLSPSHGEALLAITESPVDWRGQPVRTPAEEQGRRAAEIARDGTPVGRLRESIAWEKDNRARILARLAQEEEEARKRQAQANAATMAATGKPPKGLSAEEIAAAEAERVRKEEEAAKEQETAGRREERLAQRALVAEEVIDRAIGYVPGAPPTVEILRLAARAALAGCDANTDYHWRLDTLVRDGFQREIRQAPDQATILAILVRIARASLHLDSDKRALTGNYDIYHWADGRYCLNTRIANRLRAERLIPANSHKALVEGKPQPPEPLSAADEDAMLHSLTGREPQCPVCGRAALVHYRNGYKGYHCMSCRRNWAESDAIAAAGTQESAPGTPRACPECGNALGYSESGKSWRCAECRTLVFPPLLAVAAVDS